MSRDERRPIPRALIVVTLALLVVGGIVPTAAAHEAVASSERSAEPAVQAQPPTRRLKILNFNMAGNTRNSGRTDVADRVFDQIKENGADVVSLNEICSNQFEHLQTRLDEDNSGMHGHFVRPARPSVAACGALVGRDAGNGVFVRANVRDRAHYRYGNPLDPHGGLGGRSAACVTAEFEVWTRVCATHATPQEDGDRTKAFEDVFRLANTLFPADTRKDPFILAGDMNLPPDWRPSPDAPPGISLLYAEHWEIDPTNTPTHSEGKLDYVFVSKAHFESDVTARVEHGGTCEGGADCSDHQMIIGEASLILNRPLRIFQFVMCGEGCAQHSPSGDRGVDAVVSSIADFRPDVVTLSEVCPPQFDALVDLTRQIGHEMTGAFTSTTDGGCGNVVLSRGPVMPGSVDEVALPLPDASEAQRLVCLETQLQERGVKACAVQLSVDPQKWAPQAAAVAAQLDQYLDVDFPVIVGGDFGADPQSSALDPLYNHHGGTGRFREVDETDRAYYRLLLPPGTQLCGDGERNCRSGEPTFPNLAPSPITLTTKVDDIFVSGEHFDAVSGDATRTQVSDHVPLRSYVTLLGGSGGTGGGGPLPPLPGRNLPPSVSTGPDMSGLEGEDLHLAGQASDLEDNLSISWSYRAGAGVDPGAECFFDDPSSAATTISCTDDGEFFATLSADDGHNEPVSDTARIRLANVAPRLTLTAPSPWAVFRAGTPVSLTAPFADPGTNDTHVCTVDWDDGTQESYPPSQGTCDRSHTFAAPGMYTIDASVTDDDGGRGDASVLVIVYDPDAGFVTGGGHLDSPAPAGRAHFNFNPKYHPHDEGPAPRNGKVRFRIAGTEFSLDSTALEWLVVTPDGKAAVKGTDSAGRGFVLYAYDDPDMLRLVVWSLENGPVPGSVRIYDNRPAAGFDLDVAEPQAIDAGSIQVHQ